MKTIQYPCRSCKYFEVCGEKERTMPCAGREVKETQKNE